MEEALQLGKTYDNIWFDVAAVTYTLTEKSYVERIRDAVGFDRVLFGSDYPVVQGTSIKTMVSDVRASPYLTNEEKAKVLGLNAFKLINE
jgi:predicted TIM-barrel fold metal-dependent hydrolase